MNKDFNAEAVREILIKYPKLRIALKAGLVSRRLCKDILCITKWDMDDIYVDLISANALKVLSSSAFRATQDTLDVIAQLDAEEANGLR